MIATENALFNKTCVGTSRKVVTENCLFLFLSLLSDTVYFSIYQCIIYSSVNTLVSPYLIFSYGNIKYDTLSLY